MITLYQLPKGWPSVPNPSQFCTKLQMYLRMSNLPYDTVETLPILGPKGKLPFIKVDDRKISDSRVIIEYLNASQGINFDAHLTVPEQGFALAIQRLLEEHLFWATQFTRWQYGEQNWQETKRAIFGVLPPIVRDITASVYRFIIRKQIYNHGIGRLSATEIFELGQKDLQALSSILTNKTYFFGEKPCTVDACAFGILTNIINCPIESPLKQAALEKGNLVEYCQRIKQTYFPELST